MHISLELMTPLIESFFTVHTAAGAVQLRLVDAQESPRRGSPAQFRTPLSLLFSGPSAPQLRQDNYTFEHPTLGQQQWFVVPVIAVGTEVTQGAAYEVLFA